MLWLLSTDRQYPKGIDLEMKPDERIEVVLNRFVPAVNPSKDRLRTELLTRVQGEVIWKNAVLNSEKKQPKFVREALAELGCLE